MPKDIFNLGDAEMIPRAGQVTKQDQLLGFNCKEASGQRWPSDEGVDDEQC